MNNIKNSLTVLGIITAICGMTHPAYAVGKTAGLPCVDQPGMIQTVASDAADDLLACVGGTWHSMIYGSSTPSGAIEAFNLAACPSGWVDIPALAGRTVIGVGSGAGLTPRNLGDSGGQEMHTMTLAELVPHQVTMTFGASDKGGKGNGYAYSDNAGGSTVLAVYNKTSNSVGGGNPFNVMMPYYALLYCMKQ
jgi:hypothetical protein